MAAFVESWGLWVVFGVVFLEVAGLPFVPGETALIAASVLASQGHGNIAGTVALAIAAAVLGAGTGYAIGHRWGRTLLLRWDWFERLTRHGIARSDEFFHRHGAKAVFLGRFVPILRATLGWMAGVGRMSLLRFVVWNIAGAAAWGLLIGLGSYYLGAAAIKAIERDAAIGAVVVAAIAAGAVGLHLLRRRAERAA